MLDEDKVTILIKSCLRLDSVYRLYRSIRKNHPLTPIVIVHDLCKEEDVYFPQDNNLKILNFVDDIGLSKGRNIGLESIETPYFLLMDDDFVVPPSFKLDDVAEIFEKNNSDMMSISFYDLVFFERRYRGKYEKNADGTLVINNTLENENLDFVLNCFIAKTQRIKNILWDDEIKLGYEHDDFFLRAKRKSLVISHYSDQKIWHLPTFNIDYNSKRSDVSCYFEIFMAKHNIRQIEHVGNSRYCKLNQVFYYKLAAPLYKRFSSVFLRLIDFYLK